MAVTKNPPLPANIASEILDAWEATHDPDFAKELAKSGHSLDEYKALVKKGYDQYMEQYSPPEEDNFLDKVASYGGAAIDYGMGAVRTPIMMGAAALSGERGREQVKKNFKQDIADTYIPFDERSAPSTEEWAFNRMGIPRKPEGIMGKKLLAMPWAMLNMNSLLRGRNIPEAPGPTLMETLTGVGDAAISPSGLALGAEGLALAKAPMSFKGKLSRLIRGKGALPNQGLYSMPAKAAEKALRASAVDEARGGLMKNYVKPGFELFMDPLGAGLPKLGRAAYRSTFSEADRLSKAAGHGRLSDEMLEQGIFGSPESVYDQANQMGKDSGATSSRLVRDAYQADPSQVIDRRRIRKPVNEFLDGEAERLGRQDAAQEVKGEIKDQFRQTFPKSTHPDFNLLELDQIKKDYQDLARKSGAYNPTMSGPTRPKAALDSAVKADVMGAAYKKQAQTARKGEEELFDQISPGLGSVLHLTNRRTGAVLEGLPALEKAYRANPWAGSKWRIVKDAFQTGKTGAGVFLDSYGRLLGGGAAGAAAATRGEPGRKISPWTLLEIDMNKELDQ